jgi:hypothetical protein
MMTREQLRCAYANKYTFSGIVLMAGGFAKLVGVDESWMDVQLSVGTMFIGACLGYFTEFGKETLKAYQQTKERIEHRGFLNDGFKRNYEAHYCSRVGMHLAMKDAGLEEKVST